MRAKPLLMIPLTLGLALVAINGGRQWIDRSVRERLRDAAANATVPEAMPVPTFGTVVVAKTRLDYGTEIAPGLLREIPWPDGEAPKGAFARVDGIVSQQGKRFALSRMEEGEPVLASKITGPGQRAKLAAVIDEGMKAATFRVDEVVGVAGFVMPGDRVDVLLTRIVDKGEAYSDVILQNVKVLAVDQSSDDHADKPAPARSATVEVATEDAQRLIVAQNVGALSLVLLPAGDAREERGRRISAGDLIDRSSGSRARDMPVASFKSNATVGVTRGGARTEYTVPPSISR